MAITSARLVAGLLLVVSSEALAQKEVWEKRRIEQALNACVSIVRMEKVLAITPNNATVFMQFKELYKPCSELAKAFPDDQRVQLFAPAMERLAPKIVGTGDTKGGDMRVQQVFETVRKMNDAFAKAIAEASERLKGAYEGKPHAKYKEAQNALRGAALQIGALKRLLPDDADAKAELKRFDEIFEQVDKVSYGEVTAPLKDLFMPMGDDPCGAEKKRLADKDVNWRASEPEYDAERVVKIAGLLDGLEAPADKDGLDSRWGIHLQLCGTIKKAKDFEERSDTCGRHVAKVIGEAAPKIRASITAYTAKSCKALGKTAPKDCAQMIDVVLRDVGKDEGLEKLEREVYGYLRDAIVAEAKEGGGKLAVPGCYFFKGEQASSGEGVETVFDGAKVNLRCLFKGEQETGGWSAAGIRIINTGGGSKVVAVKPDALSGKSKHDADVTETVKEVAREGRNRITLSMFYEWLEYFWEEKWDESRQATVKQKMQRTHSKMLSFGEFLYTKP